MTGFFFTHEYFVVQRFFFSRAKILFVEETDEADFIMLHFYLQRMGIVRTRSVEDLMRSL